MSTSVKHQTETVGWEKKNFECQIIETSYHLFHHSSACQHIMLIKWAKSNFACTQTGVPSMKNRLVFSMVISEQALYDDDQLSYFLRKGEYLSLGKSRYMTV
jgi:hypothetical protein